MTTPSPAPGLEECISHLQACRGLALSPSMCDAILAHLQSLSPAQPAPAAERDCDHGECDFIPFGTGSKCVSCGWVESAQAVSELPDYVERIERTVIAANIAPLMDDWARVRFDLRELAALRAASTASATVSPPAHILTTDERAGLKRAFDASVKRVPPASGLSDFDAAVAAELPRVSDVEYNSHSICKHFAGELRKRLSTRLGKGT